MPAAATRPTNSSIAWIVVSAVIRG
jgi:hypothetical protein